MMRVDIRHLGGFQFEANARGHRALCDQPIASGGADTGMTPPEFLLASLGTCAGYYAAEYLKTRGVAADGLAVRVEAEKSAKPARLSSFHIDVTTPRLDARHQEGVLRAVKTCLVHNTLLHTPEIAVSINGPASPALAA
jgi:uncharacterized OsmC-like protein